MQKFALAGAAIACLASQSFAQSLNELYISHTGTDDQEFVEIKHTNGASLDGIMLLVIEGQNTSSFGTLDRAIDLTGQTMSGDYFVVGCTAVGPDLDVGTDNVFENGTETFYLISTTDVAGVLALVGTNVDGDADLVTDIATNPNNTILDIVAMTNDLADFTYDGATVLGPDGTFFPAGIFRGNDAPNGWCTDTFLDFNLGADRTPGAANIACPSTDNQGTSYCDGSTGNCPGAAVGAAGNGCPHGAGPNGAGGANLTATGNAQFSNDTYGFYVTAGPSSLGILIQGAAAVGYPNGNGGVPDSAGLFCVAPQLRGSIEFMNLGAGSDEGAIDDFQGMPFGATAVGGGGTTYNQFWFRDTGNPNANPGGGAEFNFSNAVETIWIP